MRIVRMVDAGHVTDILCQFPDCKRKPRLRYLYYTDVNLIIGSSCKNKCENTHDFEKRSKSKHRHKISKKNSYSNQKSLLKLYSDKNGVTPVLILMERRKLKEYVDI